MLRRGERVRALDPRDEACSTASATGASVQASSSLSLSSSARWERRCIRCNPHGCRGRSKARVSVSLCHDGLRSEDARGGFCSKRGPLGSPLLARVAGKGCHFRHEATSGGRCEASRVQCRLAVPDRGTTCVPRHDRDDARAVLDVVQDDPPTPDVLGFPSGRSRLASQAAPAIAQSPPVCNYHANTAR